MPLTGYRVLEAADGPSALDVLRQQPRDGLLFTDLTMSGGMTGLDLVRCVRELRPGLPAVLTSGHAGPEGLQDLPKGTGWLPKPCTTPDLARTLRAALDGSAPVGTAQPRRTAAAKR
jgi:CheY-like chemotaxis protein